jgi:1,4-alpha-glucan branching enzyme
MDFVLALHSHLPYVLHHGRWPHGTDWLCEAALDCYLPLIEQLHALAVQNVPAPVTIGVTPVLANQLASPAFAQELEAYFDQREVVCREAPEALAATGDAALVPLVDFWRARLSRLRNLFQSLDRDITRAFRRLQDEGRLEIIGSAATHGYLPLLSREESIRLQLLVGRDEHSRVFGRTPAGCWLPECAYRPRAGKRRGIEEHLAAAGFRYFFTDAHLAGAGTPLGAYAEIPLGAERFDAERHEAAGHRARAIIHSPYQAYRATAPRAKRSVAVLVRDPRSSMQVWSRHHGYPGDEWYLEFHKIRWPGGLKLWRVTGSDVDLGAKRPYEPPAALGRAREHARHFAHLLAGIATERTTGARVVVAPFDTELLGHWWFEGVDFLAEAYRELRHHSCVRPATASQHLGDHPARTALRLAEGSWGADGDHSMWLNDRTAWTWPRLRALEDAFWGAARTALESPEARPVLAQAGRELLLAQASDWQFMISTGAVPDYAERRFKLHCDDAERLLAALSSPLVPRSGTSPPVPLSLRERGDDGLRLAEELRRRDDVFPDILAAVREALDA